MRDNDDMTRMAKSLARYFELRSAEPKPSIFGSTEVYTGSECEALKAMDHLSGRRPEPKTLSESSVHLRATGTLLKLPENERPQPKSFLEGSFLGLRAIGSLLSNRHLMRYEREGYTGPSATGPRDLGDGQS